MANGTQTPSAVVMTSSATVPVVCVPSVTSAPSTVASICGVNVLNSMLVLAPSVGLFCESSGEPKLLVMLEISSSFSWVGAVSSILVKLSGSEYWVGAVSPDQMPTFISQRR